MSYGMVRKVDELGRVVIPKEMRRILNIQTGSSIEMAINDQSEVVMKKFSEVSNISSSAEVVADTLFSQFSLPVLVCDEDSVVVCRGVAKKDFLGKKIPQNSSDWLISPITFSGFQGGSIMLLTQGKNPGNTVEATLHIFSNFLGNLLSE